jgi:hypothetical protein
LKPPSKTISISQKSLHSKKKDKKSENERKKPLSRRTIKSSLSIHDRTQIEAVFDYYLFRGSDLPKESHKLLYQIDAFFFFPQQFGLNSSTYSKIEFFNDIRPLIRLREPKIGLKELRGLKKSIYPSPLKVLQEVIQQFLNHKSPLADDLIQKAIVESRIFACVFISALLRNISQWEKKLHQFHTKPPHENLELKLSEHFDKLLKLNLKIQSIISDFHGLLEQTTQLPDNEALPLIREMELVDEYFYYRLTDTLSLILKYSEPLSKQFKITQIDDFHQSLLQIIESYTSHAHQKGFNVITLQSTDRDREKYLQRRSELKKRFWAVFFLNLRTTPFFPMQQQIGPMLAAGLAAIWAAFAQLFILDKMLRNHGTVGIWEVSSLIIVFSAMFAYIIKDRIKEIGRNIFKGRIFRRIPDQSETIYYQNKSLEPNPIGRLTESAQFIKPQRLPKVVQTLRSWSESKSLELADHDNILHYSKEVTLNSHIPVHDRYPTRVIHDILRFNIDVCLPRLAEPMRTLPVVLPNNKNRDDILGIHIPAKDSSLEIQFIECPKTYSFDLVLQYSGKHQQNLNLFKKSERKLTPYTKYYRLTLNKSGLLRIEQIRDSKHPNDPALSSSKLSPEDRG